MKNYGRFLKNVAAFCMLIALLSLLLPFCKIDTNGKSTTVSGVDVIRMGVAVGTSYFSTGTVDKNIVLKNSVTVGDVENVVSAADEQGKLHKMEAAIVVLLLPVLFCLLSMLFTLLAEGKKTMFFPTVFIAISFFAYLILIMGFTTIQSMVIGYAAGTPGAAPQFVSLLTGIYLFTALCGIAFMLIMLGWITGGYNQPDDKEKSNRRKDHNSRDRHHRKRKHGRRKKSNKKKKDKSKDDNKKEQQKQPKVQPAQGLITGNTGIYQGISSNLAKQNSHSFTIGTTKKAMDSLINNHLENINDIANANCEIQYLEQKAVYQITSHSAAPVEITGEGVSHTLNSGDVKQVGGNVVLALEDGVSRLMLR